MKLLSGLAEGQVLQRLGPRGADAILHGTCDKTGAIHATISKGSVALTGWRKRAVGSASRGKFTIKLTSIPVGGPYRLRLEVDGEKLDVKSFFVGDVWIMAGQSNMQGIGNMTGKAKPHPLIRNFSMRREWRLAEDPLHLLAESPDTSHSPKQCSVREGEKQRRDSVKGVGVGIFFAREMMSRSGGVPQGLISTAHGGTSMQQWDPARKNLGGESLYGSMFLSVQATGQPVAGVLWYQGESESNPDDSRQYVSRMKKLVAASRRDFNQPKLPWIIVQIGRYFVDSTNPSSWNTIRELQRLLPDKIKYLETVPAIDLSMDDAIHIGSEGFPILAARLASAADRLVHGNKKELRAPQLRDAKLVEVPTRPAPAGVEITFDGVQGALRATGEPSGFHFATPDGVPLNLAFKTTLTGNKVFLHLDKKLGLGGRLYYGLGFVPYCNITDARGFSLPAFGPIALGDSRPRGFTPFITHWKKTEVVNPEMKLDQIGIDEINRFPTREKSYLNSGFVNEHPEWEGKSGLVFFRSKIRLEESMKLEFLMGYDGPFRLWIDGNPFFTDMEGTNPCAADKISKTILLKAGSHELTVGMDLAKGAAWGFFLRLARRDLTRQKADSGQFTQPVFSV